MPGGASNVCPLDDKRKTASWSGACAVSRRGIARRYFEDEFQIRFVIAAFLDSRGYPLAVANECSIGGTGQRH